MKVLEGFLLYCKGSTLPFMWLVRLTHFEQCLLGWGLGLIRSKGQGREQTEGTCPLRLYFCSQKSLQSICQAAANCGDGYLARVGLLTEWNWCFYSNYARPLSIPYAQAQPQVARSAKAHYLLWKRAVQSQLLNVEVAYTVLRNTVQHVIVRCWGQLGSCRPCLKATSKIRQQKNGWHVRDISQCPWTQQKTA